MGLRAIENKGLERNRHRVDVCFKDPKLIDTLDGFMLSLQKQDPKATYPNRASIISRCIKIAIYLYRCQENGWSIKLHKGDVVKEAEIFKRKINSNVC